MFHGIQFAVKYNKKFCIIDPYRKNKLDFFLKFLNLENRISNQPLIMMML